jgi:hypothetical protein
MALILSLRAPRASSADVCQGSAKRPSMRKAYYSICIPIPPMRLIHRGNVDIRAVYEPILRSLIDKEMDSRSTRSYIGDHDSSDRGEKYGVIANKRQESRRTAQKRVNQLSEK